MPRLATRLAILADLADRAPNSVATILGAALPDAAPEEFDAIAQGAIGTARSSAVLAVIRHMHRPGSGGVATLDAPGASAAAELRAVEVALHDADDRVVENALDIVEHRLDARLAPSLPRLIARPGPIGDRAADVLLAVAIGEVGADGRRPASPTSDRRAQLDLAVGTAAANWRQHRREPVLVAGALLVGTPGPMLARLLADADDPFGAALRGFGVDHPVAQRNLLRWLADDTIGRACARRLHRAARGAPSDLEALLADGHLLRAPRRRRALAAAVRPFQCVPPIDASTELPDRVQTHVVTLVDRLDLSARARAWLRADMISLPSPVARVHAVNGLLGERASRAAPGLRAFCFDREPAVARLASRGVLRAMGTARGGHLGARRAAPLPHADDAEKPAETDRSLLERLAAGGHRGIAARAVTRLVRADSEAFFARWLELPASARRAAALHLLRTTGDAFVAALADRLQADAPAVRSEAVALARRLRLVPRLEERLLELATGDEPRSASAAVSALAEGRLPVRIDVLYDSLDHADARMRSNAIDALGAASARAGDDRAPFVTRVTPLVTSRGNRIRGSAIRALARFDATGVEADLHAMLSDRDPLHRVSALWAARAERVVSVANHVRRLARSDRHAEVRRRALSAMRLLRPMGARPAAEAVR